jgi:hypothetical protein
MVGVASLPMWPDVKTHACEPRIAIRQRPVQIKECWLLRKDDIIMAVTAPPLRVRGAKPRVAADVDDHQSDEYEQGALHDCATIEMVSPSNENKISDGWWDGAPMQVAGGISWK